MEATEMMMIAKMNTCFVKVDASLKETKPATPSRMEKISPLASRQPDPFITDLMASP